jgi:maltodextrin utilization protein YvdJ
MDTLSASRLMRNEFKKVKDYKIMKISDFTKQKSNKEEEKTNEAKYSDSAKMDTIGSRGDKAVIFDLNTVTIKDGKTEIRFDINEAAQLYRSLKRKLK